MKLLTIRPLDFMVIAYALQIVITALIAIGRNF